MGPELTGATRDALLRLAQQTTAWEPLDLAALMTEGRSADAIVDALFELDGRRAANALVASSRGLVQQRSFLFSSSSDGTADVLCRWCGWQVHRRTANPQAVYDLAERHDCAGVETAADRDARKLAAEGVAP